jgi:hypothetical protein
MLDSVVAEILGVNQVQIALFSLLEAARKVDHVRLGDSSPHVFIIDFLSLVQYFISQRFIFWRLCALHDTKL